jgi:hypothetical protein
MFEFLSNVLFGSGGCSEGNEDHESDYSTT